MPAMIRADTHRIIKPEPRIGRGQRPLLHVRTPTVYLRYQKREGKKMAFFTFNTTTHICTCQSEPFNIGTPRIDLYDSTARQLAQELSEPELLLEDKRTRQWKVKKDDKANKPSQIRKIYDELCMWEQKAHDVETFAKLLPFIKMMNAKVAYARGRELVDDKFVAWFSTCMDQIRESNETGLNTFKNFRTHFEAFLGFFKQARPS